MYYIKFNYFCIYFHKLKISPCEIQPTVVPSLPNLHLSHVLWNIFLVSSQYLSQYESKFYGDFFISLSLIRIHSMLLLLSAKAFWLPFFPWPQYTIEATFIFALVINIIARYNKVPMEKCDFDIEHYDIVI